MCDPISIGLGIAATALGASQASQAAKAQKSAASQAAANAKQTADLADQDMNRRNGKKPNVGAITSANQQAAAGGPAGTMLTGPMGINPTTLTLGTNTVLGQ